MEGLLPEEDYSLNRKEWTLTLGADARNIEIDFSARNYSYPDKILYAYRIKGIDEDWVYTNGDRQYAFYNKLPVGKYKLELRATDVNGLWSGRIVKYTIIKKPAFYETWWAYTLYFFVFAGLLLLLYRRIKRRMELRNELRISQIEKEKSEELTQAKLSYFTNVSHDFLTPITIISCLIDDVEITYRNSIPQLEKMRSNLRKLKRLIQQVLDFRKMESGNMKLKITLGNLSAFIGDMCKVNFEPLMHKKHILCRFSTDNEQVPAYFDADKMEKVIFNLLSNAYKYTDEGGEINVALSQEQQDSHSYVIIRVSDTGRGIRPENLPLIFNRFFTDKEGANVESNGIGLSLVKEMLDLHHAQITVQSEWQKGTSFIIRLPIDKDSYHADEFVSMEQIAGIDKLELVSGSEPEGGWIERNENAALTDDRRMLIVEDNEELLDLMYHIFSRRRQVYIAHNGVEALSVIENNEVDIVVSDVMMPVMDGLELCRHLKADIRTSHIPVILLTAKTTAEDRVECYRAGADGYIAKPFELKVLEARIENFLACKRVRQEEFQSAPEINTEKLETSSIDQKFLNQVIAIIEKHMEESDLDMGLLSDQLCMSKSTLYRKIKVMTGLSPVEFVRNIRLKHAHQLLETGEHSVANVAYASGFSNPKYFSTCFKEQFGISPKDLLH